MEEQENEIIHKILLPIVFLGSLTINVFFVGGYCQEKGLFYTDLCSYGMVIPSFIVTFAYFIWLYFRLKKKKEHPELAPKVTMFRVWVRIVTGIVSFFVVSTFFSFVMAFTGQRLFEDGEWLVFLNGWQLGLLAALYFFKVAYSDYIKWKNQN